MSDLYMSVSDMKEMLSISGESFLDGEVQRALEAASRGIDELCQDVFTQGTVDTARYFDAADSCTVKLRPSAGSITSVKIDEDGDGTFEVTLTAGADYLVWPYNNEADAKPWWELHINHASSYRFPSYQRSVEVTGRFGWATLPSAIAEATGLLAAKLLKRAREAPFGIAVFGTEGGMAMRIARNDPDVMFLIGPYMRDRVTVA